MVFFIDRPHNHPNSQVPLTQQALLPIETLPFGSINKCKVQDLLGGSDSSSPCMASCVQIIQHLRKGSFPACDEELGTEKGNGGNMPMSQWLLLFHVLSMKL